jgi:hypothetical protein
VLVAPTEVVPVVCGAVITTCAFVAEPVALPIAGEAALGRGGPSGSRHVTSRLEQKSGMVVRSVDGSAAKAFAPTTIDTAAATPRMNIKMGIPHLMRKYRARDSNVSTGSSDS